MGRTSIKVVINDPNNKNANSNDNESCFAKICSCLTMNPK